MNVNLRPENYLNSNYPIVIFSTQVTHDMHMVCYLHYVLDNITNHVTKHLRPNNLHTRKWIWKGHLQNGSRYVSVSVCMEEFFKIMIPSASLRHCVIAIPTGKMLICWGQGK